MKIKTIALVASSGNIDKIEDLDKKIKTLKKSFKVKEYFDKNASLGYLADSVENRVNFFQNAFLDNDVDLVISIRGGFGAIQIVDKINYDLIKNSNKIYLGSSDATILLAALNKKTKIKCYHSLMISNGFIENLDKNIEIIENDIFDINLKTVKKGKAKGVLWGGNLSSLVSLFSSESFLPDGDIVLFLEDLNEPLYKIDKMLYEIYRFEALRKKTKGIIFGDFYIKEKEIMPLIKKYAEEFDVPCAVSNDISHKPKNVTIPYGKQINILF